MNKWIEKTLQPWQRVYNITKKRQEELDFLSLVLCSWRQLLLGFTHIFITRFGMWHATSSSHLPGSRSWALRFLEFACSYCTVPRFFVCTPVSPHRTKTCMFWSTRPRCERESMSYVCVCERPVIDWRPVQGVFHVFAIKALIFSPWS